jgi:plastocyanin
MMTPRLLLLVLATPFALHSAAEAQQQLGSVAEADASVTATTTPPSTVNGRVLLVDSGTVTAKDHTAAVKLARGGAVDVCSTSGLHLTAGTANDNGPAPLMLSLDRGAMEIHMAAGTSDIIMTPDLRMSVKQGGRLDLRIRVTANGDTCVENRIPQAAAPTLAETAAKPSDTAGVSDKGLSVNVASLFGEDSYEVKPGQHVMFEHADLHEVVDNESSPCGCPAETPSEVAGGGEFGLGGAKDPHPFPAAVSEGLAPPPPVPQAPPGLVHAQVSTTLNYSGDGAETPPPGTTEPPMAFGQIQQAAPPPPPAKPGFLHRLGRFFKRLF